MFFVEIEIETANKLPRTRQMIICCKDRPLAPIQFFSFLQQQQHNYQNVVSLTVSLFP